MSAKSATTSKAKPAAKKSAAPKGATRKAARTEAPAAVTGPVVITIPHDQIAPSTLNPRKTISEEYITDLAASMLAKGQLQNISVRAISAAPAAKDAPKQGAGAAAAPAGANSREHTKKIKYEIVFGEQRWRAIGKLVADGHLPKDTPVLARVMPIDDAEHIELAIMENQDRNEVHPLEQAEAYARLAELRAVTAPDAAAVTTLIAERTGQTTRNIQLQLQVARNLTPETKQAWTDGKIATRKMAIAIARQPAAIQAAILEAMEWDDLRTPQDLAQWLENAAFKADVALFDLAAYEKAGGVIALHPASDEAWLDSQDVFLDLQGKAAEKRAGDLSKILGLTRPAQKSATYWTRTSGPRLIDEASGPDEGLNGPADCASSAHVEYAINAQTGIAWFGLVGAEQGPAGTDGGVDETTAAAKGDTVQPLARRNWLAGGAARTRVVRDAIRAHPDYALAVSIVALLPKHRDFDADLCAIRTEWPTGDSAVARQDMEDIWPELLTGLPGFSLGEIIDRDAAMTALLALTHEELLSVFAHMIANRCSDVPFTAGPGAKAESCVIAGLDGESDKTLAGLCDTEWLKAYTVAQLQALAHDSGAASALEADGKPLPANKASLVDALPAAIPPAYVPPEARFLSADAAEAAVKAMLAKGATDGAK